MPAPAPPTAVDLLHRRAGGRKITNCRAARRRREARRRAKEPDARGRHGRDQNATHNRSSAVSPGQTPPADCPLMRHPKAGVSPTVPDAGPIPIRSSAPPADGLTTVKNPYGFRAARTDWTQAFYAVAARNKCPGARREQKIFRGRAASFIWHSGGIGRRRGRRCPRPGRPKSPYPGCRDISVARLFTAAHGRTEASHGQTVDSAGSRRGRGGRAARGARGALPRLCAVHHHAPGAAGRARRAQAGAPAHPLRHAAPAAGTGRRVQEVRQDRRRRHGHVPPPRRPGDLRRPGAARPGFFLALSAGRRAGQLRFTFF